MQPLYLFVGKSASGKTTIANLLEENYNYKPVESYTTRPPRYVGERGHTFVSENEFDNLEDLAAYTEYNGHKYGTTNEQLDSCDLYVIDVPGVETLLERYTTDREIYIIYFDSNVHTRILRMIDRHDSDMAIINRLLQDEQYNWYSRLRALVRYHTCFEHQNITLHKIDANKNIENVLQQILCYINDLKKEDDER